MTLIWSPFPPEQHNQPPWRAPNDYRVNVFYETVRRLWLGSLCQVLNITGFWKALKMYDKLFRRCVIFFKPHRYSSLYFNRLKVPALHAYMTERVCHKIPSEMFALDNKEPRSTQAHSLQGPRWIKWSMIRKNYSPRDLVCFTFLSTCGCLIPLGLG